MSESLPTNQVSLDDLKRAIENAVAAWDDKNVTDYGAAAARASAWRAAFEWHVGLIKRHADLSEQFGAHLTDWIAIDREEEEGMALIRGKLR